MSAISGSSSATRMSDVDGWKGKGWAMIEAILGSRRGLCSSPSFFHISRAEMPSKERKLFPCAAAIGRHAKQIPEYEVTAAMPYRSEERRVGKEGRSRWAPDH